LSRGGLPNFSRHNLPRDYAVPLFNHRREPFMSTTDQLLVKAFRQTTNGAKFASSPVVNHAPVESMAAVDSISTAPPHDVAAKNIHDAAPDDTRSRIGLLNRQAAGIEAEESPRRDGAPSALPTVSEETWQAALEVDHFAWPPIVDTVLSTAGAAIGQLADRLGKDAEGHTQFIEVLGDRAESGATTMTLSLAKLFAAQQRSVVLVDLDEPNPNLAQALGVKPLISWLATLDEGVAIEEVLIESVHDRITLSPLCQSSGSPMPLDAITIAERFWLPLAKHFDVILVDCRATTNSDRLITTLSTAEVSELVVVADNRGDDATVAELARPQLERIRPDRWSVIRNFSDA